MESVNPCIITTRGTVISACDLSKRPNTTHVANSPQTRAKQATTRPDSGLISCEDAPRIVGLMMKDFRYKANVLQPSEGCWAEVFMDAFFGEQERK